MRVPVPPDACQAPGCLPGDTGPCMPLGVETVPGGLLASYEHVCGAAWQTRWDDFWWPVERTYADVAEPERRAA